MSVWILHLALTAEQEAQIMGQTRLELPFSGYPDLSAIVNAGECRRMVQALRPDDPPESIALAATRLWDIYGSLHPDDIIVVPLPLSGKVGLAVVDGRYIYEVGEDGADRHWIPVIWPREPLHAAAFKKFRDLLRTGGETMHEVTAADARTAFRDRLPHGYNRFAAWKWLLVLFFILNGIQFVLGLTRRM